MKSDESSSVRCFSIKRIADAHTESVLDKVATEEPLEIRIRYWFKDVQLSESLAITMRTPGHDLELAAGFLVSEGIARSAKDITEFRFLGGEQSNEIVAELSKDVDVETWKLARHGFVSSSCGLCGKRNLEAVARELPKIDGADLGIDSAFLEKLPALLEQNQTGFAQTGGLHAAALVSVSSHLEATFEDIGRHNALDKLIGWSLLKRTLPLHNFILFLSSRSSFELVQKTAMAGCPVLATVGGPSSLAIEAARRYGITLIGFLREGRFNIYSGEWRINS